MRIRTTVWKQLGSLEASTSRPEVSARMAKWLFADINVSRLLASRNIYRG